MHESTGSLPTVLSLWRERGCPPVAAKKEHCWLGRVQSLVHVWRCGFCFFFARKAHAEFALRLFAVQFPVRARSLISPSQRAMMAACGIAGAVRDWEVYC